MSQKKGDDEENAIIMHNVDISRTPPPKPFNYGRWLFLLFLLAIGNIILWPHGGW